MNEYKVISNQDYHADKSVPSKSTLSQALKTPAHLYAYLNKPTKKTDAMKLGTFIHEFIENGLSVSSKYTTVQQIYQRTTGSHPAGSPKVDENGDPIWTYDCILDDTDSLTPAKSAQAKEMTIACSDDLYINTVLSQNHIIEPSYYGKLFGHDVKARPDIVLPDSKTVVEIKTANSIDEQDLARDMFDMDYDMQAYIEMELSGADKLVFFFVSSECPAGTATFTVDKESMTYKIGKHKCETALENYNKWKNSIALSFHKGPIDIPLSYKATNYLVKNGLE